MNLFFKNSPLHDGAVVISGERIIAARCTLPITERTDLPASYGMRHKAAMAPLYFQVQEEARESGLDETKDTK